MGSFAANGYGLFDMAGNVWEWCWDLYGFSYYSSSPSADPAGAASGSSRVLRGGSWRGGVFITRVSYRVSYIPPIWDGYGVSVGFRLARGRL